MPGTKDVLQGFRDRGYSASKSEVRTLELTPEEQKSIPEDAEEICLSVYGTFSDGVFKVSRVEQEKSDEVPEGPPNRAMPSPS